MATKQFRRNQMGFSTDAIHVGQEPDPLTGAIVAPIYQTSTYVFEDLEQKQRLRLRPHQSSEPQGSRTHHRETRRRQMRPMFSLPAWRRSMPFSACCVPATTRFCPEAVYGGMFRLTTQLLVRLRPGIQLRRYLRISTQCRARHQAQHAACSTSRRPRIRR